MNTEQKMFEEKFEKMNEVKDDGGLTINELIKYLKKLDGNSLARASLSGNNTYRITKVGKDTGMELSHESNYKEETR